MAFRRCLRIRGFNPPGNGPSILHVLRRPREHTSLNDAIVPSCFRGEHVSSGRPDSFMQSTLRALSSRRTWVQQPDGSEVSDPPRNPTRSCSRSVNSVSPSSEGGNTVEPSIPPHGSILATGRAPAALAKRGAASEHYPLQKKKKTTASASINYVACYVTYSPGTDLFTLANDDGPPAGGAPRPPGDAEPT